MACAGDVLTSKKGLGNVWVTEISISDPEGDQLASGTVYRRDDRKKPWVAHATWMEGARRRQSKRSFATKKEAQTALAELVDAHEHQLFVARSDLTLEEYSTTWLEGLVTQGRKRSTITGYQTNLKNYILPSLGTWHLQDLRPTDLDQLYAKLLRDGGLRGRPISMTTVHHVHVQLGKMLHDAERKGLVIRNVARLADAPSQASSRSSAPEMTVWTPAELQQFLEFSASYRAGPMLRLLAMTGIRRGELVALEWKHVDLSKSTIAIRAAASVIGGVEIVDTPKTRRGRRTVDLDQETRALLKRHRANQLEELLAVGAATGGRVFTNEFGEPLRPGSVGQAFRRLVDECDVPRIRLHDLRHTHASHLLAAGVNAKVVSERLGHSSVSFTLDTYGHVMPGQQADAAEAAAALLTARPSATP